MAAIKKDHRVPGIILGIITGTTVLAFVSYFIFGAGGAICGIGLGLVASACFVVWLLYYYRCPSCRERLPAMPDGPVENHGIRHHCSKCDVIWESGLVAGSVGEP